MLRAQPRTSDHERQNHGGLESETVAAAYEAVNELELGRHSPPCITARRGGCVIKNFAEPPKQTQPGWFSFWIHRKTTPSSLSAEALRYFFDGSAIPPCVAARRGITLDSH